MPATIAQFGDGERANFTMEVPAGLLPVSWIPALQHARSPVEPASPRTAEPAAELSHP